MKGYAKNTLKGAALIAALIAAFLLSATPAFAGEPVTEKNTVTLDEKKPINKYPRPEPIKSPVTERNTVNKYPRPEPIGSPVTERNTVNKYPAPERPKPSPACIGICP